MNCGPGVFSTHVLDSLTSAFVISTIGFRLPGTEPEQNMSETIYFICAVQLLLPHGKQSETKQAKALISISLSARESER